MSTTEINVNSISEALNDKMDRDFGNRLKNFAVNISGGSSAPIPDWNNLQGKSYDVLYTADQDGYFLGGGYVVSASAGLLAYLDNQQVYEWNCNDANGSGTWYFFVPKGHTYKATGGYTSQWCKFVPTIQSSLSATVSLVNLQQPLDEGNQENNEGNQENNGAIPEKTEKT